MIKLGRRKFLQFGAAAPLATRFVGKAYIGEQALKEAARRAPGYGAIGRALRDEVQGDTAEHFFDPLADMTRKLALMKTVPRWYFESRYGMHFDPRTSENMKSWSPAFKRIFDHEENFRQYRVSQVRAIKSQIKQFLWQKAGKDLP